ncbi:MAG: serine/threonine protein kinase [Planctomycetes bacterium]|nr:serine/threonine protein kinase [Planctomycetota bacterium]
MEEPFKVVREIGRGATGAVYEVRVPGTSGRMAAKVLEVQTDQARQRFQREGEIMARFHHPNVASVHGFGLLASGAPYLLLDLVEGGTLASLFEREGTLSEERTLELLTPVASGLAHAHELGTTHRDLKPANVLLTREGRPILTDFGVAKSLDLERLTLTGAVVGTPAYMAPEQARAGGEVGPWTDVFAFGLLCYEALTGELPYGGQTDARAKRGDVSPGLGRLVERCLAPDSSSRYSSGVELVAALQTRADTPRVSLALAGAGLALLLGVVALGIWLASPRGSESSSAAVAASPTPTPTPTPIPTPDSGARVLALELALGDIQRYHFRRTIFSPVAAQDFEWSSRHVVTSVEGNVARIKVTFLSGRLTQRNGYVVFDSEQPSRTKPAFRGMITLLNRSCEYEQNLETGEVRYVVGGTELVQALAEVGHAGMFWLSNESLQMFLNGVFGWLPRQPVELGERWEVPAVLTRQDGRREVGLPIQCQWISSDERGVRVESSHTWNQTGYPKSFSVKGVWRAGAIQTAHLQIEPSTDPAFAAKLEWSLKLLSESKK